MDLKEMQAELSAMKLLLQELEHRVSAIESGERGNGVFLDGASEVVTQYIMSAVKKESE